MEERLWIPITMLIDLQTMFLETAVALLSSADEAPWVLLSVQHRSEEDLNSVQLPSWVPRWDHWDELPYGVMAEEAYWYKAGGNPALFHPELQVDLRQMKINGLLFDHIRWVSSIISKENFGLHPARWNTCSLGASHIEDLWEALIAVAGRSDEHLYDSFLCCLVRGYPFGSGLSSINMERLRADFREYRNHLSYLKSMYLLPTDTDENGDAWANLFQLKCLDNRRLIFTEAGRLGIAPNFSCPGDRCCVVPGLANPLILRRSSSDPGKYSLVGASYISNVMNGEIIQTAEADGLQMELIALV